MIQLAVLQFIYKEKHMDNSGQSCILETMLTSKRMCTNEGRVSYITSTGWWGVYKEPLLVAFSELKTSAGCPAIRRHKVLKGDPDTKWH